MDSLITCAFSRWSPGLGDNHFMGWVTVLVYFLTALASAYRAIRGPFPEATQRRERIFWWLTAALLAFLAINKQLDLQSLLTSVARCLALDQGWYDNRRAVQRWFIEGVLAGASLVIVTFGMLLRRTLARTGLALLGLVCVSAFVVIRAASFHHVDALIGSRFWGLRVNWLLELPGPLFVLWATFRARGRIKR